MTFNDPQLVSSIVWQMRIADYPRGSNRAAIDRLFNGFPPLSENEREAQQAHTNVNKLSGPKIAADARRTYNQAFFKTLRYFNVTLPDCTDNKRLAWENIITREINRPLKKSLRYFEFIRSQQAMTVLHGIGTGFWSDSERWCPVAVSPGDIMIPSGTLLTMENLTMFAVWRQFTPYELRKLAKRETPDKAWNQETVDSALKWCEGQIERGNLIGMVPSDVVYAPERLQEWFKENTGYYGSDIVPTIDCWMFFYQDDSGDECGWKRCIVVDTPGELKNGGTMPDSDVLGRTGAERGFLYYSDDIYARDLESIVHFQFGDASSVGPFRYHTVRSLGWLLYSMAHLENRLFCKRMDATFENAMQYFRVSNPEDKERVTKIDLHNFGVVPEGIQFVTQQERWNINPTLLDASAMEVKQSMVETASQFREGREASPSVEKTATQVMAEVNSANAIVGSMLLQAYTYAGYQYREIARRFCIPNSVDPDVREFRKRVLKAGVPEEYLDIDCWDVTPEQSMGSGNKMLQIAIADKLMAARNLLGPAEQREVLHDYFLANGDDPAKAERLVPEIETPSNTAAEADQSLAALLMGIQVRPKRGENQIEVVESWLAGIAQRIRLVQSVGPDAEDIIGLQNALQAVTQRVQLIAQDPNEAERVKQYGEAIQALAQVIGQMQPAEPQQQNGQLDPVVAGKLQAQQATAAMKNKLAAEKHAQQFAQKQVNFAQDMAMKRQSGQLDMAERAAQIQADILEQGIRTGAEVEIERSRPTNE